MISFYPGPSRVYDAVPRWVKDAHSSGVLSMNHRSPEFSQLYLDTMALLRKKLRIPADHDIFFTSSATECWEIIAQSLIRTNSIHVFNGAFGEKWFEYTRRLRPGTNTRTFSPQEAIDPRNVLFSSGDLI